jgi:hypothetical protein
MLNTNHLTQRKDVTALDADVPLLHPSSIHFKLSELRLFQCEADRFHVRHRFGLCAP